METTTFTITKKGSQVIFEALNVYEIDELSALYRATSSRKEKAVIREKYLNLVAQENNKRGFKCFNTVI